MQFDRILSKNWFIQQKEYVMMNIQFDSYWFWDCFDDKIYTQGFFRIIFFFIADIPFLLVEIFLEPWV